MRRLALAATCAALLTSPALGQTPLGTSFTYQGRLMEAGSPANGTYDFRFILYDAPSGGNQVGPTVTRDDVFVSTGLFTVGIDFGAVFSSQRRFLEVAVRPGASTGAYDTVSGRHELTVAPSALFGASAPWTGVTGKPAGFADNVDNDVLGGMVCPIGQVAKSNGAIWLCDVDQNTTYSGAPPIQVLSGIISIPALGITSILLADNAVTSAKIADNSVGNTEMADNAIGAAEMADNSVGTAELQNAAVTASKIAASAVQTTNIAPAAVGANQIAPNSVGSLQIANDSIGPLDIAPDAIGRSELIGTETALYQMAGGCGSPSTPTFASQCLTIPCGGPLFNNCAGQCNSGGPVVCANNLIGYLLSASIP